MHTHTQKKKRELPCLAKRIWWWVGRERGNGDVCQIKYFGFLGKEIWKWEEENLLFLLLLFLFVIPPFFVLYCSKYR